MTRMVVPLAPCHFSPSGVAIAAPGGQSCTCKPIMLSGPQHEIIKWLKQGKIIWRHEVYGTTLKSLLKMNLVVVGMPPQLSLTEAGQSAAMRMP